MLFSDIEQFVQQTLAPDTVEVEKTAADESEAEVAQRLDDVLVKQAALEKRASALRFGKLLIALDVFSN